MHKNIVYLGIAMVIGIGVGYFIFGRTISSTSETTHEHNAQSHDMMWTCSMHPQIKQSEAGDCPICGMDLIQMSSESQGLSPDEIRMTKNAIALANIETVVVEKNATMDSSNIVLSGMIKANENNIAVQVTHFSGRIEKLVTKVSGETIRKGQILATIYSPELVAAQQELLTAARLKKSQPALYKAVRNKLKLRKLSDNQIHDIESSGKIQEKFPVRAEISGLVSEIMIQEGDHINRGQVLFKVENLNTVWASFEAYENQIASLKKGQSVNIKTNAYPDKQLEAKISFIDPVLKAATRTVEVRTELSNTEGLFKPGMFIEGAVVIKGEVLNDKIIIPKSSILWTGKRSLVYIRKDKKSPVFAAREITLGNDRGDYYEILQGLDVGEEIVTRGTFTVDAAAQLQGKKSMMNTVKEDTFSENFQKSFGRIINTYIELKDGLVDAKVSVASDKAAQMLTLLNQFMSDHQEFNANQHVINFQKALKLFVKEEDVQKQRDHFILLSENLITIIDNFQLLDKTYYVQKCPMANSNKGAVLLSNEKQIRNPYFGDAMLTCGSVINVL